MGTLYLYASNPASMYILPREADVSQQYISRNQSRQNIGRQRVNASTPVRIALMPGDVIRRDDATPNLVG
jgi:hypothetical protein